MIRPERVTRVGLARQLEDRRRALGLSIVSLVTRSGYSRNTVERALLGRPVNLQTLVDIANALGYEIDFRDTSQ